MKKIFILILLILITLSIIFLINSKQSNKDRATGVEPSSEEYLNSLPFVEDNINNIESFE